LELAVTNGSGVGFADADVIALQFIPAGAQGIQGPQGSQGSQGIQGNQGIQGIQGDQGVQGIQGVQGVQGVQGIQGPQGSQGIQGDQGIQGIQGDQGVQGIQGIQGLSIQGTQGTQGFQGVQGNEGTSLVIVGSVPDVSLGGTLTTDTQKSNYLITQFDGDPNPQIQQNQGIIDEATGDLWVYDGTQFTNVGTIKGNQGTQGTQGPQGVQGFTGIQGPVGNFGGATFNYTFSNSTLVQDPGISNLALNNSTQSSANRLSIDQQDDDLGVIDNFLVSIDSSTSTIKGHFKISTNGDPSEYLFFAINDLTNQTGWWEIDCTFVSGSGVVFVNNDDVLITFARTGDIGNQGSQGIQGIQGDQGVQGEQGIQGLSNQGIQGIQGDQGVQGIQGDLGIQGQVGAALKIIDTVEAPDSPIDQTSQATINADIDNWLEVNRPEGAYSTTVGPLNQGDAVIDDATGDIYIYDGADWSNSGNLRGPQGPQGVQGTQGIQGDQGVQGIQGLSNQGIQGDQGIQGIQGDQGIQGVQGDQGIQGIQGDQGVQGTLGNTGLTGPQGTQGVQGIKGDLGDTGIQGTTGPTASVPDDIENITLVEAFDGVRTEFTVQKGGVTLTNDDVLVEVSRLMISVGGIIQEPDPSGFGAGGTVGFRLNTSNGTDNLVIRFAEAPDSTQSFFGVVFQQTNSPTTTYATREYALTKAIIFGV